MNQQQESDSAAPSIFTAQVAELVAIGAAIASNCEPCFKYHYDQARKLGVSDLDMRRRSGSEGKGHSGPCHAEPRRALSGASNGEHERGGEFVLCDLSRWQLVMLP